MPVPQDDMLCRFVRPRDWNQGTGRPSQRAFAQPGLSVWHIGSLLERGVSLEDLRIEHLAGYGQAHHTTGDYLRFAAEAAESEGTPFQVTVEWRHENEYVTEPWRTWGLRPCSSGSHRRPSQLPPRIPSAAGHQCPVFSPAGLVGQHYHRRSARSEYGCGEIARPNTSSSDSGVPSGVLKRRRWSILVMCSHTVVSAKRRPGQRRWPVPKGM